MCVSFCQQSAVSHVITLRHMPKWGSSAPHDPALNRTRHFLVLSCSLTTNCTHHNEPASASTVTAATATTTSDAAAAVDGPEAVAVTATAALAAAAATESREVQSIHKSNRGRGGRGRGGRGRGVRLRPAAGGIVSRTALAGASGPAAAAAI